MLSVTGSEEVLEGEADRAAAGFDRPSTFAGWATDSTRNGDAGEATDTLPIRFHAAGQPATTPPRPEVSAVLREDGRPLDGATRSRMEAGFGRSFAHVRIHTDGRAAAAARAVDARAFTSGHHVVFGAGRYAPATGAGRRLLAHELAHVVQQESTAGASSGWHLQRQELDPAELDEMRRQIAEASRRYPHLAPLLSQVTLRAVSAADRTTVQVDGRGTFVYPTATVRAQAGYYLHEWEAGPEGRALQVVSLATGQRLDDQTRPVIRQRAGFAELQELRRGTVGIVHVTQTVVPPTERPEQRQPSPEELELPLHHEISEAEFRRTIDRLGRRRLIVPGVTGGTFDPDRPYGRPLNFTYFTHDGTFMWVSRRLVDREFYYVASVADVQNYLRTYAFEYAGLAAAGWIPITRILFDVGISFIPIIGPLYGLAQAAITGYHAYQNWDRMSGWEKGLAGVTVLLSVVPAIRAGRNIARGAASYRQGVRSLVNAGLPQAEASRLMLAAGIFQSQRSTLRIVDTLGDALRRNQALTAAQLRELQGVFQLMLQRLPAAERSVIAASFATQDLNTAREFFEGVQLTERHLEGLRRLAPEVGAALQRIGRTEPIIVERVATWAAASQEVAEGINKLVGVVRPQHLTRVLTEAGEDVLAQVGRASGQISPELAAFVRSARSGTDAYRRLMQGTRRGRQPIEGLISHLQRVRPQLPGPLSAIESEFSGIFLTVRQLEGLSRLGATSRQALHGATDSQLRLISTIAEQSADAARAIDSLANQLAPVLARQQLPAILERFGGGLLETVGRAGVQLRPELLQRIARMSPHQATRTLLSGVSRRGTRVPGLLDDLAQRLTTLTEAERAIRAIEFPGLGAEFFARWATTNLEALRRFNPTVAEGIEAIQRVRPSDAIDKIAAIHRELGSHQVALDVFESLAVVQRRYGAVPGFDRLVAGLATGGNTTRGSLFVLHVTSRRNIGSITGFEVAQTVEGLGRRRVYDVVTGRISWEFKYWLGFGGNPAKAAADEFARDVVLHAASGFRNLRWAISRDAATQVLAIQSMMRGVLARREVREALRRQGISATEALRRLEAALQQDLILTF
jgi:hypothetical protein